MRRGRACAPLLIALAIGGCGDSTVRGSSDPPRATAPAWVADYCADVARLDPRLLCPVELPLGLAPSPNAAVFKPDRHGYILEGYEGDAHWVVLARREVTSVVDEYGTARQVGVDAVHSESARIVVLDGRAGLLADHVALEWREDGVSYAMTVHRTRGKDDFLTGQEGLEPYAEAMAPAGRRAR